MESSPQASVELSNLRPLIVGEVLFDHFPDGSRVLGGAPFNVAWNLQGLAARPRFISAVGDDAEGRKIRDVMTDWRMDTSGVATSCQGPTGQVRVTFEGGEPQYDILDHKAYDDIRFDSSLIDASTISLIYHGSLCWRHERTRQTIIELRRQLAVPVFVDLNIRWPWFDISWTDAILDNLYWLKLNQHELTTLTDLPVSNASEVALAAASLQAKYGCKTVFVTVGEKGAHVINQNGKLYSTSSQPTVEDFVDSVGAGDAFAAATIDGSSHGLDENQILEYATCFASQVCCLRGATTSEQSFYRRNRLTH